jgi:hypothetical protein
MRHSLHISGVAPRATRNPLAPGRRELNAWRATTPLFLALTLVGIAYANPVSPPGSREEAGFLAENRAAMDRMMAGMTVSPSGDVDHDFTAMMVPHHQGAIDMAQAELRYGRNEQLRRIAQEIIVEQQQEIVAMRLALGQPLPPSVPAPDQPSDGSLPVSSPTAKSSKASSKEP